ncbi:putative thiol protease ulp-4 [Aphelenchoides besseyi]|nr:putative thiol protease ulp-4 [Aphelenchoides besseyi]KAI6194071.1 putative thiol protease ulp-4 [Aphelenchoides besseyi]
MAMDIDYWLGTSGDYSSTSSSSTRLGSQKWKCGVRALHNNMTDEYSESYADGRTVFGRYQRRNTTEATGERFYRQEQIRQKRKRARQQYADHQRTRPLAYASSADFSSTDDEMNTVEAALEEVVSVDLSANKAQINEIIDDVTNVQMVACLEAMNDMDESDLSDSEMSDFGSETTDTEREEDGFNTTDFEDDILESDSDEDVTTPISKLANVLSDGKEIVRHRFPYLSMRIFLEDFKCLMDEEFVNDTIVDFCLNHFIFNVLPEDVYRIHAFPSIFFYMMQTQLLENVGNKTNSLGEKLLRRYSRLSCFVEDVNLFENDFMVIPLNDVNHWSLCIVCCPNRLLNIDDAAPVEESNVVEPRPCILLFDSQLSQRRTSLMKFGGHVREFLQFAFIYRYGLTDDLDDRFSEQNLPVVIPNKLPQQTATYECGVFMLEYVRNFFINPPSIRKVIDGKFDFLAEYPTFSVTKSRTNLGNEILSMSEDRENVEKLLGHRID